VTRNIRMLIGVALAAGAVFGYWHFLLAPKRAEADRLAVAHQAAEAEIAQSQATLAGYRKSRSGYYANYADVVRLGKAVPADDDVRSLILQLDTSASRSGVDFASLQLSGGGGSAPTTTGGAAGTPATKLPPGAVQVGSAGFSQMPFQFVFQGDFSSLEDLFGRMERLVTVKGSKLDVSGRLLRVESIQLAPGPGGFPDLAAQITASSYLAPAQQGLTAGATPAAPAGATAATTAAGTTTSTPPTTEVAG
jgi:hypothetical protein